MAMLKHHVSTFAHNKRGSIGVTFSLAMIPVVTVLAMATDYSMALGRRSTLQQILDASALALAKDGDIDTMNPAQVNARAMTYAKKIGGMPVDQLQIAASVSKQEVKIDGTGLVKLNFGFFGTDKLAVKSSVTVTRQGTGKLEIALALDNTGSMAQSSKITELKKAIKALVTYMQDPAKNKSPTKIAMIPFTTTVRANKADLPEWIFAETRPNNWNGCITDRNEPYNTNDSPPANGVADSLYQWGTWVQKYNNGNHYGWGNGNGNQPVWEYQAVSCGNLATMIPLTSDLSKISDAADDMIASGNTNVTIGVEWGMHALTASEPMTGASPEGTEDLSRVLIVLTDGDNTQDRFSSNQNQIDTRTRVACNSAKAKGLIVYTIRVIDGNANLLRECASDPSNYYGVTQASQLTPVFEKIAGQLSKLRIAR